MRHAHAHTKKRQIKGYRESVSPISSHACIQGLFFSKGEDKHSSNATHTHVRERSKAWSNSEQTKKKDKRSESKLRFVNAEKQKHMRERPRDEAAPDEETKEASINDSDKTNQKKTPRRSPDNKTRRR